MTDFGLLVNLKIDLVLLGVELFVGDTGGGGEFIGRIEEVSSAPDPVSYWNETRLLVGGGMSEVWEALPFCRWLLEVELEETIVGEGNKDVLEADAAEDNGWCTRETCDALRNDVTVLAEPGIGGNIDSSMFPREGTRGIADLVGGAGYIPSVSAPVQGSPLLDVRVGDMGKGGTSSFGEEMDGR